jgi:hypothetical protein
MPTFDSLLSAARKPLWLDYGDYAGALLAQGAVPWLDVSALVAWQRKAQGLLKSDVLQLPVATVCAAWLAANPPLREAMAAKKRTVFPLKTLLADEALRAHLVELAKGLRTCFAELPLALACPSPRHWVAEAFRQAHGDGEAVEVGDDETDSAAVYVADFLRSFGDAGVDVLLLQESLDSEPASTEALALYQPVLNIAAHYRWSTVLDAPAGRLSDATGFGFLIAASAGGGRRIPTEFWSGAGAPDCPPQGFRHAAIPAAAQPESVLQRLAELRT